MSVESCALLALLCAIGVGIITFLRRDSISENWRKKFIRRAKKHGAHAEAYMTKKENRPNGNCMVTYEYQVEGTKYRKSISYDSDVEYHKKLLVYYAPKNPAQGMFEEIRETYSVGFHVFCWSFLTLIFVFGGLEVLFGSNNMNMESPELRILISNPQILIIATSVIALYALEGRWVSQRENARKKKKKRQLPLENPFWENV